ncbi:MAG: hypothetical protein CMO81_03730 [Waddliaceae bacterium]|nr:hypothetical protein [Waddliaceae bacterium]
MKEFLRYLVQNLVDRPDAVEIHCSEEDEVFIAQVRVDPDDVGKVVGRRGTVVKALRTIASIAAARLGRRVRIEVLN